jgi:outer membrane protein assembly factor BamB
MYREIVLAAPLVVVASGKFVFGIEVSNGMTRWAYALKAHPCRAVVANDRVYVAGHTELACLEYLSGKQIFHINTQITTDVTLMVDGERIYLGSQGRVACFDHVGRKLWSNDLGTSEGVGLAVPGMAQQVDIRAVRYEE